MKVEVSVRTNRWADSNFQAKNGCVRVWDLWGGGGGGSCGES